MLFTMIICVLSILLFLSYAIIRKGVLHKRMVSIEATDSQQVDEELILDMAEYKENVTKLALMSAGILALTIASFFIA